MPGKGELVRRETFRTAVESGTAPKATVLSGSISGIFQTGGKRIEIEIPRGKNDVQNPFTKLIPDRRTFRL